MTAVHVPVLTAEVLRQLRPEPGGVFVDCTVGLGGHTRALLEAGATRVIGLDRDEEALAQARTTLSAFADRVDLVHADYRTLEARARRPRRRSRRRRAGRSRRLVDAVRRARPRIQLSARRAARHADGSHVRYDGREPDRRQHRAGAGRHDLRLRRRALLAPHCPRARRGAARGADRHDRPACRPSSAGPSPCAGISASIRRRARSRRSASG